MSVRRLTRLGVAAGVLAVLLLAVGVGADDDAPPDDDAWPGGAQPAPDEPAPPEGVRRPRPQTEEEERRYKQERTRSDPFLNAPPSGGTLPYNPADWVSTQLPLDSSLYLIQDAAGKLVGTLSIATDRQTTSAGDYLRVVKERSTPREHVEMVLFRETLRPRRITIHHPARGSDVEGEEQRTEVDYLFDRITIERRVGIVQTGERMRALPFSYDVEQLPLIVRQIRFLDLERADNWPFEAFITVPQQRTSRQLRIEKPRRAELLSAEPQSYPVFELQMRLDDEMWTWWVERFTPHRLVRFSDGTLTYNLHEYVPANSY